MIIKYIFNLLIPLFVMGIMRLWLPVDRYFKKLISKIKDDEIRKFKNYTLQLNNIALLLLTTTLYFHYFKKLDGFIVKWYISIPIYYLISYLRNKVKNARQRTKNTKTTIQQIPKK